MDQWNNAGCLQNTGRGTSLTLKNLLIIGNYPLDYSYSMNRYARMLKRIGRRFTDWNVACIQPRPVMGRFFKGKGAAGKWAGYWDKHVIFPQRIRQAIRQNKQLGRQLLVHIADHSNAPYIGNLAGQRLLITCHDLFAIRAAQGEISARRVKWSGQMQQKWIAKHLRHASDVLAVSAATTDDWKRLFPESTARLRVQHSAVEDEFCLPLKDNRVLCADGPFILHVGNTSWYKNRMGVLQAFAAFAGRGAQPQATLQIVGPQAGIEEMNFLRKVRLEKYVRYLGRVNPDELVSLYQKAVALIFPSIEEGFGWPVLEAQACGCPVVGSNCKALTEILGDSALLFPAAESVAMGEALEDLFRDPAVRSNWSLKGLRNVDKFRDNVIGPQLVRIWEDKF